MGTEVEIQVGRIRLMLRGSLTPAAAFGTELEESQVCGERTDDFLPRAGFHLD
jgi:hypothetical protein